MFLLSMLSSRGFFGILLVFFVSIASNLTSDILFFSFGRGILKSKWCMKVSKKIKKKIKPESALFLSKFVYGTRIITVVTLGTSMKLKRFIFYDTLALIPITVLVLLLGWFAGKGINLFYIYKPLIVAPLVIFIIFIIIKKCLNKKFVRLFLHTKKQRE